MTAFGGTPLRGEISHSADKLRCICGQRGTPAFESTFSSEGKLWLYEKEKKKKKKGQFLFRLLGGGGVCLVSHKAWFEAEL